MGRLIDAGVINGTFAPNATYTGKEVMALINQQPTAYSVNDVVERLGKLIINNKSVNKTECENMECLSTDCIECMTLHAINIVKEGTVKDE
jgi:hypothetical protein